MIYKNDIPSLKPVLIISFFFALFAAFPLVLLSPAGIVPYTFDFSVFSIESICCLSLLIILLNHGRLLSFFKKYILHASAFIIILAIECMHVVSIDNYHFTDFLLSITIFAVPLSIYLCQIDLKKHILPLLSLFWLLTVIHSLWQICNGLECIGIAGNRNWNSSLLLSTTPFAVVFAYDLMRTRFPKFQYPAILYSIQILATAIIIYDCKSKGACLSLAIAAFILLPILFPKSKYMFFRFILYGFAVLIILILFKNEYFIRLLFQDVRFSLWNGVIRLIMDNPLLGVSSPAFESSYASYRPIGYFIKETFVAIRTIHAHNEFLFVMACYGVFGLIAWLLLWIYPVLKLLMSFKSLDLQTQLCVFSLLFMIIHSQVDMVIAAWPNIFISGILLGCLWRKCWPLPAEDTEIRWSIFNSMLMLPSALIILFVFISTSFSNLMETYYLRNAKISFHFLKNPSDTLNFYSKSCEYEINSPSLLSSGLLALKVFKDPYMSLYLFDKISESPLNQVAHSNRFIAESLMSFNRKNEALAYIRKDTANYPISVVSLSIQLSLEEQLGLKNDAEATSGKLLSALNHMGLDTSHLPAILKNPYYEWKFVELRNMGK
ncbi:MAG TPA: hypothetical protein DET40_09215 [Lentisphaeria bacterium]|nr:MAG: hypothetical protein A2X45_08005 [Lentisphaerae bacterium GWF2_50_93]HCE43716.1 hypothetical protein [Lentisphaeria bacterium]